MTNQTPESVIAEALVNAGAPLMHSRVEEGVASALRVADMLREPGVPDAATAAIERVRAVLSAWEMVQARNRECFESGNPGMIVPIDCTGGLRAALDGAPEPEAVEWEERLAACDKHGTHCWSCTRHTERRRPAGEWHRLPVEGEIK